ncbi:hypothetical protein [Anaerostipes hominis (ex Lee et al. 2021)]|uniref:Uncharacterized protein n=1 Tax=Anaerostipes hominis (ex Lee et al. 2021) TaxID=2025494 RepID=A0ABV4DFW1_9FIRM|nr:hypothetical protein [Anaerostipes hominis (ex Lee et al. 2021)]
MGRQQDGNGKPVYAGVCDRYSDAVYLDGGCFYTIDQFIRNMEEGKEYYLGNICLMH